MELTGETKLKDLFAEYPQLKDRMGEINPMFSLLATPMGKVMVNRVSLADVSKRSGMELDDLIGEIQAKVAAN